MVGGGCVLGSSSPAAAAVTAAAAVSSSSSTATTTTATTTAAVPSSSNNKKGLLERRVTENMLSPPSYGMEGGDIYYPDYFIGTWDVESLTIDVQAPCGILFFGGNNTYNTARSEINNNAKILRYRSRFIKTNAQQQSSSSSSVAIIADRAYNVESIATASMGMNSILNIAEATPNKFSAVVAPAGSATLYKVDIITLNRKSEHYYYPTMIVDEDNFNNNNNSNDQRFDCSEVVRQIVVPIQPKQEQKEDAVEKKKSEQQPQPQRQQPSSMLMKEIETTSLYRYDATNDIIKCQQRSATFLLPSQQDPIAMQMWQATNGRPIDVRFYNVVYTRRK